MSLDRGISFLFFGIAFMKKKLFKFSDHKNNATILGSYNYILNDDV